MCRYSVPPDHGKRLERLAQGEALRVLLAHCVYVLTLKLHFQAFLTL